MGTQHSCCKELSNLQSTTLLPVNDSNEHPFISREPRDPAFEWPWWRAEHLWRKGWALDKHVLEELPAHLQDCHVKVAAIDKKIVERTASTKCELETLRQEIEDARQEAVSWHQAHVCLKQERSAIDRARREAMYWKESVAKLEKDGDDELERVLRETATLQEVCASLQEEHIRNLDEVSQERMHWEDSYAQLVEEQVASQLEDTGSGVVDGMSEPASEPSPFTEHDEVLANELLFQLSKSQSEFSEA